LRIGVVGGLKRGAAVRSKGSGKFKREFGRTNSGSPEFPKYGDDGRTQHGALTTPSAENDPDLEVAAP
jgi:hypothetical protein